MEYEAECLLTLAQLLEVPDCAFSVHLAYATDPAVVTSTVAGHVALFAERVVALSLEERQELFAETFRCPRADRERCCLVAGLRQGDRDSAASIEPAIEYLRSTLLRNRNPYVHLVEAVARVWEPPSAQPTRAEPQVSRAEP
jgi:nitrate reductase assembly molybdenum cofactor insertion protein NarJ